MTIRSPSLTTATATNDELQVVGSFYADSKFTDPETGEVSGGGDMLNPGGNYFTQACGAVQLFSGDRFTVGWGWSSEAGNNTRLVSEHDAEGRVVFALSRSAADCMPNSVNPSYRCVKYE